MLMMLGVLEEYVKQDRHYWVRPFLQKRKQAGEFFVAIPDMLQEDPEYFFDTFRFTPASYNEFLSMVGPLLSKNNFGRDPISTSKRLLMTLDGDSQKSIAKDFRVGRSTACNIIKETCTAIVHVLQLKVLPIPTTDDWLRIGKEFREIWHFPNCVGAIDGKHFAITKPPHSGTLYYNYKGFCSLVLLASCDANYNFTTINIDAAGSESDGGIFRRSRLGQMLLSSTLNLPLPVRERHNNVVLPHVFTCDEAFPLLENVMRPYPGDHLTVEQRVFNYRLSRARRVIENTFGILVARWHLVLDTIYMHPQHAELAIKACIMLHNYVRAHTATQNLYTPPGFVDYEDSS